MDYWEFSIFSLILNFSLNVILCFFDFYSILFWYPILFYCFSFICFFQLYNIIFIMCLNFFCILCYVCILFLVVFLYVFLNIFFNSFLYGTNSFCLVYIFLNFCCFEYKYCLYFCISLYLYIFFFIYAQNNKNLKKYTLNKRN
jgi:hypothetical protein